MRTIICDMESKNIVGSHVRRVRRDAKPMITQKELMARLQVLGMMIDQSGLSKIENGQRPVSDIEVVALAKALRISPLSLLQEHKTPHASAADKVKATESDSKAGI
jgi:HTH-type transcriptional regulator, cell division transcriptional repressor